MNNSLRIAVADDQKMFRTGLINLLNNIENVHVVVEAADGKELIKSLQTTAVDVAFVDYRMPELNGISTAKIIRDKFPTVRVIILSMYDDEELIIKAIENGANGYLVKDDEPEEIKRAIDSVMSIGYYANDRTSKILITKLMA